MTAHGWPAPAKLNLFLHVTGRRPDGYHQLQTAFRLIDLHDTLYFARRSDGRIRRLGGLPGLPAEADLAIRAARRLQAQAGIGVGADIRIVKRIPAGSGLGGGSSDAATTLWALNRLWGLDLGPEALAAIGLELGADVPVFVHGRCAWAEGIGEVLTPMQLPPAWYLVVVPPVCIRTADVFGDPALTRSCQLLTINGFLSGVQVLNVCEPVVRQRAPEVGEVLDWLGRYAPARMTGTGSAVFAPFPLREAAESVRAELPSSWLGLVCRGLDRSPLLARVAPRRQASGESRRR